MGVLGVVAPTAAVLLSAPVVVPAAAIAGLGIGAVYVGGRAIHWARDFLANPR